MHNIRYLVYDESVSRAEIMADIREIAERNGEGYHSSLTWHDNVEPLYNQKKAEDFIREKDNGWYDDHAVRFHDYEKVDKTKKMLELEYKIKELSEAKQRYKMEHSVHTFKAKYIGCEECGSKLSREHLVGEKCPLCKNDLRSKTTLEKLKWYDDKVKECVSKFQAEKEKQRRKSEVRWLIKIEFHS